MCVFCKHCFAELVNEKQYQSVREAEKVLNNDCSSLAGDVL